MSPEFILFRAPQRI